MSELSCPTCRMCGDHKMDCQNASYVSRKDKRIAELEAELKWLQSQHVRVCSSESNLKAKLKRLELFHAQWTAQESNDGE